MNKLWEKFDKMTGDCYMQLANGAVDISVWEKTFQVLLQAIEAEKDSNPNFGKELYRIDDELDYCFDVTGWLEDYLDELDMRELYDEVITVCKRFMEMFEWNEESPSELKFRIASALGAQQKNEEALQFCEKWYQEEKDNIMAATATVYARLAMKEVDAAEQIIKEFIHDDTTCDDENDILFMAAQMVYKLSGNKKMLKRIEESMKEYEEKLERFMYGMDDEDEDFDGEEDWLPF